MPPAASQSYDASYAHNLMEDLNVPTASTFWRAVTALLLCGLGAFVLLSMLSFNPFDSTADTAGLGRISNKLGAPGASLANILMQLIGSAAFVLGGLTLFSGLRRLFKPRPPRKFWDRARRSGIFAGCVALSAGVLSAFPIPQDWPMASGLGGWIGDGIFLNFRGGLEHFNIPVAGLIAAFVIFVASAFALARFIGIVSKDVLDLWDAAGLVWATFRVWFDKLISAIRAKFDKTYGTDIAARDSLADVRDVPEDTPKKVRIKRRVATAAPAVATAAAAATMAVAAKPKAKPKKKPKAKKPQFKFDEGADFVLPTLDLLKMPPPRRAVTDEASLVRASENLHRVMGEYGIKGEMGEVRPGPVVTLFEFEPAPGMKSQRIINLSDDIARNMSAQSTRIAVVPGRNAMGVELPNKRRETVWLRDMLASDTFQHSEANLPMVLGEDIGGEPFVTDLSKMPHLLVAGTTGSGKSVGVNAMILSLMYKLTPEECKFIMIDPKMLELSVYDLSLIHI